MTPLLSGTVLGSEDMTVNLNWSLYLQGEPNCETKTNQWKISLGPLAQDGGVEGRELTPHEENTKITTNC